jgi:hypothetical protein
MFWYNEVTINKGEFFSFVNIEEAQETLTYLVMSKVPHSLDVNPYSGEVFITTFGSVAV